MRNVADQWTIGRELIPEAFVCEAKRKTMELLVHKLEQGINPNDLVTVTNICFIAAAGDMMVKVSSISKKIFASNEHRRLFFVAYQDMGHIFYTEFCEKNISFNDPRIVDGLFKVSELVGETLAEEFLGQGNSTEMILKKTNRIAHDVLLELPFLFKLMSQKLNIFGTIVSVIAIVMNVLVLPVYITFYHKNHKVYEMLYVILLSVLDLAILFFYFIVTFVIAKFARMDSSLKCLTIFATGDIRIGFDIRIIAATILQACLSVEKFLQIWQIAGMKKGSKRENKRILRCVVAFGLTLVIVITLQGICLQGYKPLQQNFAVKHLIEILTKLFNLQNLPNQCDILDPDKILFQNVTAWILRISTISSALISMVFNILTGVFMNRNNNDSVTSNQQKASTVYFKQIVLCTILLSLIITGAFVSVIANEFVSHFAISLYLIMGLPNAVSFFRNGIYIGTSAKLRSHIQDMICSKSG